MNVTKRKKKKTKSSSQPNIKLNLIKNNVEKGKFDDVRAVFVGRSGNWSCSGRFWLEKARKLAGTAWNVKFGVVQVISGPEKDENRLEQRGKRNVSGGKICAEDGPEKHPLKTHKLKIEKKNVDDSYQCTR